MFYIYEHVNVVNEKRYIGITNNPDRRWRNGGYDYKDSPKFMNAIKKYGWDCFEHNILDVVKTKEEADEKEIFYISFFDSVKKGYNIQMGGLLGSKNMVVSEETMKKISKSLVGNKRRLGVKHSSEDIKKMIKAQSNPIIIIEKSSGKEMEFLSARQASKSLGYSPKYFCNVMRRQKGENGKYIAYYKDKKERAV